MEAARYQIREAATPRYGHRYDVIDTHMQLEENRVHSPACDVDHARQIASSLNYWHECRLQEGRMHQWKTTTA